MKNYISESDSEDDVPLSMLGKKKEQQPKKRPFVESDDSDDDIPLAQIKRQKPKKTVEKKPPTITKQKSSSKTPSSKKPNSSNSFKQQELTEALYECTKGKLVQQLLCRWWYALEWPEKDTHENDNLQDEEPLDGFDGAYIAVRGQNMGSVIDKRSNVGKPSFLNFFAQPAGKVKELLLQAYSKQMEALEAHEGSSSPLLKELQSDYKKAERISTDRADKEANKVIKQWKTFAKMVADHQENKM